jgi:hypothetical protein
MFVFTKFPSEFESEHVRDLVSSVNNVTYMFDILKYKLEARPTEPVLLTSQ